MNEIDYRLIGTRVKETRILMNISQEQLSWDTGLTTAYISQIETGKKKPSLGSLLKISNKLGITLDELLTGNQIYNPTDYQTDIDILMADCSPEEKRFIFELLRSSKEILRRNSWSLSSEENNSLD